MKMSDWNFRAQLSNFWSLLASSFFIWKIHYLNFLLNWAEFSGSLLVVSKFDKERHIGKMNSALLLQIIVNIVRTKGRKPSYELMPYGALGT